MCFCYLVIMKANKAIMITVFINIHTQAVYYTLLRNYYVTLTIWHTQTMSWQCLLYTYWVLKSRNFRNKNETRKIWENILKTMEWKMRVIFICIFLSFNSWLASLWLRTNTDIKIETLQRTLSPSIETFSIGRY